MALDIVSKIFKPTLSKAQTNICEIFFLNKGVVLINVSYIFHSLSVKAC